METAFALGFQPLFGGMDGTKVETQNILNGNIHYDLQDTSYFKDSLPFHLSSKTFPKKTLSFLPAQFYKLLHKLMSGNSSRGMLTRFEAMEVVDIGFTTIWCFNISE